MAIGSLRRSHNSRPGHRPGRSLSPSDAEAKFEITVSEKPVKIFISIDYGTKTVSVAYRFYLSGSLPSPSTVFDVHMAGKDYFAPQRVAWARDGTFYWGYGVQEALKRNFISHEDVIELWKLLLYKDHSTSELVERIEKQLGDRDVEDLICQHLIELIAETKRYIKNGQYLKYTSEEIDALPVEIFLSVPQMWKPPANRVMTSAARKAGIASRIELVYEPQCSAAYYLHNIKDAMPKHLETGDVIQLADVGGGTGDFVSYQLLHSSEVGAKVELRLIAEDGALCGSELVNQNFISWMKIKVPNFEAQCRDLGISQTAWIAQASQGFESIKVAFTSHSPGPEYITIRGSRNAVRKSWEIDLTADDIKRFFEPVIAEIFNCIDRQLTPQTKVLLIPGGFGRSEYFVDRLNERYSARLCILNQAMAIVGAYQPVSRGALLRYSDIKPRGMPSNQSFGIAQVEEYHPARHPDATYHKGQQMSNGRVCRQDRIMNPDIVERDQYDDSLWVVYERWVGLTRQGDSKEPIDTFITEKWQEYNAGVTDSTMTVQVYWTDRQISDHDSIRVGKDAMSPLKDGIEEWECLEMPLSDLDQLGFQPEESAAKGMVYKMFWRLTLKVKGANICLTWEIAEPAYDENGEYTTPHVKRTVKKDFELFSTSHNPCPREAVD